MWIKKGVLILDDLLYSCQKHIVDDLKHFDQRALFMGMSTGKSITFLALYEQKLIQGECIKLLVVCLCTKLNEWKHNCEKWFPLPI